MRMIQKHVVIKLTILNAHWSADFTSRLDDSKLQNHSTQTRKSKSEKRKPKSKKEIQNEINRRTHSSFRVPSMLLYSYHSYNCVDLLFHFYNICNYIY